MPHAGIGRDGKRVRRGYTEIALDSLLENTVHMHRALLAAVAAMTLLSPAPAKAQVPPSTQTVAAIDMDVRLRGFRQRVLLDTVALWQVVNDTPAHTYGSVRQLLDSLKVPYTNVDSVHGRIWNKGFVTRLRFAGKQISASLRCGSGPAGDYADNWRISVAYAVYIEPSANNGTRLGIALIAGANDIEGASKPAVQCSTTGAFEQQITQLVKGAAAR